MEFLINNFEILIGLAGTAMAWFGGRRLMLKAQVKQSEADVTSTNLGNVTSTLEVYKTALDDLEIRFKKRIDELEEDLDKMKTLNDELRAAITSQEKYIKKLSIKLAEYEKLGK